MLQGQQGVAGEQTDRQTASHPDGPRSAAGWPYLLLHQQGSLHSLTPAKHGLLPMFFHPARNKARSCQTRGDSYTSRLFLPLKERKRILPY